MSETPDFAAQSALVKSLHEQAGHGKAMLEVQIWAEAHKDMLRGVGLLDSLLKLTLR